MTRPLRVAVVRDYPEEGWASMDLTGEMMLTHLSRECAGDVEAVDVCPPFRHRLTRWPVVRGLRASRNVDRLLNRFGDYPRALHAAVRAGGFDLYHLVDHSYSQLVHELPPGRAVVTCHDLDTFRCLLEPEREPRPRWFRAMAGRTLAGLKKAAAVVCNSETTRRAILAHDLVPESRLHLAWVGVAPEFSAAPDPSADAEAARWLGPVVPGAPPDLLHVGSTIPRKRIDLLLEIFAALRRAYPGARLIKAGAGLNAEQERLAETLGVADAIVRLPFFAPGERGVLAAVYRRASLVVQPSDAEGFGLPVAEALACGATVLASDLPALREVGGDAAVYRPVGDIAGWVEAAAVLLDERVQQSPAWHARHEAGLARASLFQWPRHARQLADIYRAVLAGVSARV
ncbi:MAG: glycosyltransferase family 1 protein [Isosphaeraceae bacterium]|nr:glycosyltransferase family 1 protein [Isosphaeraceae bacterium]